MYICLEFLKAEVKIVVRVQIPLRLNRTLSPPFCLETSKKASMFTHVSFKSKSVFSGEMRGHVIYALQFSIPSLKWNVDLLANTIKAMQCEKNK